MKKTRWLSILLSVMVFQTTVGQIYDNSFNTVAETSKMAPTPNSPEAQAFTKYGDVPVSMYTGTPNVQIPLFVFDGRELDLPISLTYDASGIKVEQLASTVGLGWNLNVGGRVSRIANGLPDDFISGGNTNIPYKSIWDLEVRNAIAAYDGVNGDNPVFGTKDSLLDYMVFLKKVNDNEYDTQPDYFSFNALGNNDTFVIDVATGNPIALNNPRNKVTVTHVGGAENPIAKWEVTTDDGTVYHFEQAEITRDINISSEGQAVTYGFKKEYHSSWLLTKIVSATGKDTYEFIYTDLGFWNNNRKAATLNGVTNVVGCIPDLNNPANGSTNTPSPTNPMGYTGGNEYKIKQLVLNEIKYNDERIVLFNSVARDDMDVNSAIEDIYIYSKYDTINQQIDTLQSFHFNYDYFRTNTATQPYNPLLVRLKLDEIEMKGNDGITENKYAFEYNDPYNLPSTTSKAQDYYGYYNGVNSNTVLYPKAPTGSCMPTDGADRDPNFSHAKKGLLSKITYPTGGYSEFDYEPNYEKVAVGTSNNWTNVANISLTNGTLPGYDSTVCNSDVLGDITPSTTSGTFEVTSNGNYRIVYSHLGSPGRNYTVNHVATLVKIASATSTLSWDQIYDSNCNTKPGVEVIWTSDLIDGFHLPSELDPNLTTITYDTALLTGHYQLVLANPFDSFTNSLNINKSESSTNYTYQEKAGIRVKSIKDYTDVNVLAKQKNYEYPSGTVISEPIYQYYSDQYIMDASQQQVMASQILHRVSYASSTTRTHIGYGEVKEVVIDHTNPSENLTTSHKFNTASYGNYRDGVYTYYINGKETSKQYSVSYELGKPQATENYDDSGNLVSKSSQSYYDLYHYSNTGIHLVSDDSKSHLYPIPTPHPSISNYWYIDYIDPAKVQGSNIFLPGTVELVIPPECNASNFTAATVGDLCTPAMAKLVKYNVSSYGKVGNTSMSRSIQYFNAEADKIEQVTNYEYYDESGQGYPVNYLLKEQSTTNSIGETIKQEIFYPENKNYTPLINKNMVNIPVQTRVFRNDTLLSDKNTAFTTTIFPDKIQTSKGGQLLEDRLIFERFEDNNLVQVKQVDGTSTAYVWGHDGRYIVAKVENATYAAIEGLSSFGLNFSIADDLSQSQENDLRAMSNVLVTTYTYEPSVGVTSITDPRKNTITYEYDTMNRLISVKDRDGNILSENQYHYKN